MVKLMILGFRIQARPAPDNTLQASNYLTQTDQIQKQGDTDSDSETQTQRLRLRDSDSDSDSVIFPRHENGPIAQSNSGEMIVFPNTTLHMECLSLKVTLPQLRSTFLQRTPRGTGARCGTCPGPPVSTVRAGPRAGAGTVLSSTGAHHSTYELKIILYFLLKTDKPFNYSLISCIAGLV